MFGIIVWVLTIYPKSATRKKSCHFLMTDLGFISIACAIDFICSLC